MTECNGYCYGDCKDCDGKVQVGTTINVSINSCHHSVTTPVTGRRCNHCGTVIFDGYTADFWV